MIFHYLFMRRRIFQPNVFPRNCYQSMSTLCHRFYGTCLSMISTNTFPHNKNSIILPAMKPALELVRPVCLRRRLPKIYPQITIIRKLHRQLRSFITPEWIGNSSTYRKLSVIKLTKHIVGFISFHGI